MCVSTEKQKMKKEKVKTNLIKNTETVGTVYIHTSSSISVVADASACISKIIYKIENAILAFINIGSLKQFNIIFVFC